MFFSIKFKPLTFIEHLPCALMVTGRGQHTLGLNRINNSFMKKTSTGLETVERERDIAGGRGPGGYYG